MAEQIMNCPKCGREDIRPSYHAGGPCAEGCSRCHDHAGTSYRDECKGGRREHLSYTCRCGHYWHTPTLKRTATRESKGEGE